MRKVLEVCNASAIVWLLAFVWPIQAAAGRPAEYIDWAAPLGTSYDKAEFRFWTPNTGHALQGVVVLTPGTNEDGRMMVGEPQWQAFALRHDLALIGCWFTDKPFHDMTNQVYANASTGSGQALLDALDAFALSSANKGVARLPLFLWGFSAGGQFNYEFVAWKPDRVAGFIVNKGGIYYSALLSPAARAVPGLMVFGGRDLEFRKTAIQGLFAINRRAGALWALVEEPTAGHIIGQSREIAEVFFEDLMAIRLPAPTRTSVELRAVSEDEGFRGDPKLRTTTRIGSGRNSMVAYSTSWLPSDRMARVWRAVMKGRPLPD